jgi:hypothetical protein
MSPVRITKEDEEMTVGVAVATLIIAFLVSLAIVKLATIIVPGLPFWPAMGILWLIRLFF